MQNPYYHPPASHSQHGASYDLPPVQSVVSLPQPQFQQGPPATTSLLSAPPSRPGSSMKMAHLLQPLSHQMPNVVSTSASPYSRSYESSSGSPTDGASVLPDAPPSNGSVSGNTPLLYQTGNAGQQQQQQQLPPQKRAYRQRRKDPSCDACRERKVKCDASESASCTECINRKVRCQFTKETNRRMSSIKQVQDLEKQLLSTKQQLQQLRSGMMKTDGFMDIDIDASGQPILKLPDIGHRPPRRTRAAIAQDLSEVRSNLRKYGRGVMKVPVPYRQQDPASLLTAESPRLPPKNVADRLLALYFACMHSFMPVIHWPSFVTEYERVYQSDSLLRASRDWAAALFAVFACASLQTQEPNRVQEGKEYLKICHGLLDMFKDDISMDQVRAALLASVFLHEIDSKSASWVWLGSAVRLGQEICLHIESGSWSAVEIEMRRRLWWGLYCWDRILSLEVGKPVSINDQDCDIDLPCPMDEQYISEGGVLEGQQTSLFLATVHVVRSMGHLIKALRSPVMSPTTLETFERHFTACLATFPVQYHPKSDQYLDPRSLPAMICLQNTRFALHRHNLSPFCPHDARLLAMDYCLSTALDTSRLVSRCMQTPSSPVHGYGAAAAATAGGTDWRTLFVISASAMLCAHVCRCVLLLLFRQEYAAALVCIQACSIIGDSRAVNIANGRYVAFFLRCLLDRLRRNNVGNLERDEEMIAYMSGDMQGTTDGSWVWQGSNSNETVSPVGDMSPEFATTWSPREQESEAQGWDWIERTVQCLLAEKQQQQQQQQQQQPQQTGYDRMDNNTMQQHPSKSDSSSLLSPEAAGNSDTSPRRSSSAHSRMTIASII